MKLSLKATRFVIEALEHYRQYCDQQMQRQGLTADDISDLVNDQQYLEAIQKDFEHYRDTLLEQPKGIDARG